MVVRSLLRYTTQKVNQETITNNIIMIPPYAGKLKGIAPFFCPRGGPTVSDFANLWLRQ